MSMHPSNLTAGIQQDNRINTYPHALSYGQVTSAKGKCWIIGKVAVVEGTRIALIAAAVFFGMAPFMIVGFKIKFAWSVVCIISNTLMASLGVGALSYKNNMRSYTGVDGADIAKFIVTAALVATVIPGAINLASIL